MAQRFHHFALTSDKDASPSNFSGSALTFPPGSVVAIEVQIPSGHMHKTGVRVLYGTSQVIPKAEDTWLQGNHKTFHFDLDDPVPGGSGWFIEHYNADSHYDHTFHVTFELDELTADAAATLPEVLLLRRYGGDALAPALLPGSVPDAGSGRATPV